MIDKYKKNKVNILRRRIIYLLNILVIYIYIYKKTFASILNLHIFSYIFYYRYFSCQDLFKTNYKLFVFSETEKQFLKINSF